MTLWTIHFFLSLSFLISWTITPLGRPSCFALCSSWDPWLTFPPLSYHSALKSLRAPSWVLFSPPFMLPLVTPSQVIPKDPVTILNPLSPPVSWAPNPGTQLPLHGSTWWPSGASNTHARVTVCQALFSVLKVYSLHLQQPILQMRKLRHSKHMQTEFITPVPSAWVSLPHPVLMRVSPSTQILVRNLVFPDFYSCISPHKSYYPSFSVAPESVHFSPFPWLTL